MLLIASDRLYATVYANIIGQTLETATCSCQVIVRSYMPFNSLLKDEMFLSTFALVIALTRESGGVGKGTGIPCGTGAGG